MIDFHVYEDPEALSQAAARFLFETAQKATAESNRFTMALSGGSTPKRLFEILSKEPYRSDFPWNQTIIFWGDERAVAPDNEWSNYKLAQIMLESVPLPEQNIFRIHGERGAEQASELMRHDLEKIFGNSSLPSFDVVLQGMGGDGHTASLFPGTNALDATEWVVPVIDPPATPAVDRITLSFPVLNAAQVALFLATGTGKRNIIAEIVTDPTAPERYPAARVEAHNTHWFVDEAAFSLAKEQA